MTTVGQKSRRVPFALQKKVTAKVEDLIAKDIVERVDGPTSWVSPVVAAPKASGDMRLCVDMRKVNKAISGERIPISTVDKVLKNLNGSGVFSKLDLRLGFHQIESDGNSRDNHVCYTRGIIQVQGTELRSKLRLRSIRQMVLDIGGVQNVADYLIVMARTMRSTEIFVE